MRMKDLFGITKMQRETELKIALEKLQFLASEMEKGKDRIEDVRFWMESLDVLEEQDTGKSFLLRKTREAYSSLFKMFLQKHGSDEKKE